MQKGCRLLRQHPLVLYNGIPKGQCPFGRVQHEETSFFMFGGAHYKSSRSDTLNQPELLFVHHGLIHDGQGKLRNKGVHVQVPAEPCAVAYRCHDRIQKECGAVGNVAVHAVRVIEQLPHHHVRRRVRDDIIGLICARGQIGVGAGDFVRLCGLGRPPVQPLAAVFAVMRGRAAECEDPLAVDRVDLAAHQVNDVFCVRMYLNSAAEHLGDRLLFPEVMVIVIAVHPEDCERLFLHKLDPLVVIGVVFRLILLLFLLFLFAVLVKKRESEITQNDQIVIFARHTAGAAQILVHELGHIQSAVRVAGKVDHDRLFLSVRFGEIRGTRVIFRTRVCTH